MKYSKRTHHALSISVCCVTIFLFAASACTDDHSAVSISKNPYLIYTGINTEMKIQWQTPATTQCRIEWGTSQGNYSTGGALTEENSSDRNQHIHSYTITGLTPGIKYYYQVWIDGESFSGDFNAAPAASATAVKFIAYGDTRTNEDIHNTLAGAVLNTYLNDSAYQTVILSVGDLVSSGDQENIWDAEFFSSHLNNIRSLMASAPFLSCVGNHDRGNGLFEKYFTYPYAGNSYWSFDYGPVHVTVVDQYVSYITGSAQYLWLDADLDSTKVWKIILLHQPGWSAGGGHENNADVQNYIEPLCESHGISIVIAGHNHYYARAEVVYDTDQKVYHITTGGGGAPLHTPLPDQPNVIETEMAHHFCKVDISGTTLSFSAVTSGGTVIDSFVINK